MEVVKLRDNHTVPQIELPSNIPPEQQETFLALGPQQQKLMEALLSGEYAGEHTYKLCEAIGISRNCYYKSMRNKRFLKALIEIREAMFPYQRSDLCAQIIRDAMQPLKDAYIAKPGPKGTDIVSYAPALVKTREQAAALLGVTLKQPEITEHRGSVDVIHGMMQHPKAVLEEFTQTGKWPEGAEKPTWLKE